VEWLAVPLDTLHWYSLPRVCCKACGGVTGWGRQAQASSHGGAGDV